MLATQTPRRRAVLGLLVSLTTVLIVVGLALGAEARRRRQTPDVCRQVDTDYARDFRRLTPCMKTVRRAGTDYLMSARESIDESIAGFPLEKTPGVKRIVVLGESSGDLFGGVLQQLMQTCGQKFEVMNCADTAGALEDVERKWEEVREYSPDVTVLVFGHNISFERPQSGVRLFVEEIAAKSCVAVSQLGFRPRSISEGDMPTRLAHLDSFLNRLGQEVRQDGGQLVVSTMAGNLWKVPFPAAPELFLEARYLTAAKGRPQEIEYLRSQLTPTSGPMVDFLLGEALARNGQPELARKQFLHALEKDTDRSRAPPAVNDRIRRFAATGALLRDTEKVLTAAVPDHLPGWETFVDNCHLIPRNVEGEALAVTDMLLANWSSPELQECSQKFHTKPPGYSEGPDPQPPMLRTLRGASNLCRTSRDLSWCFSLELAVERRLRNDFAATDAIIRNFLGSDEWRNASGHDALPHIAAGYAAAGYEARAQELLQGPDAEANASVWAQRGLFELTRGQRDEAAKSWTHALSIEPLHPAATHWSKRLQEELSRKE